MYESMYKILLLDQRPIGVVGNWLVGWLVDNAVFSETSLRIFFTFCMRLGDYKGRKDTELDF